MNRPDPIDPSTFVPQPATHALRQPAVKAGDLTQRSVEQWRVRPTRTVLVVTDTGTVLLLRSQSR